MATDNNEKETKIVKAAPKKTDNKQDEEPRVTVKAAVKPQVRTAQKQAKPQPQPKEKTGQRPPLGKPVANKELENRTRPPMGKPVISKEIEERGKVRENPEKTGLTEDTAAAQVKDVDKAKITAKEADAASADNTEKKAAAENTAAVKEAEKKPAGEAETAEKTSGAKASAEAETAEKASGAKASAEAETAEKTSGAKASAEAETAEKASGEKPAAEAETAEKASGAKPAAEAETAEKASGAKPAAEAETAEKASGEKPAAKAAAATKGHEDKPQATTGVNAETDKKPENRTQRSDRPQQQTQRSDRPQGQGQRSDRPQSQSQRGDRQQSQGQRGDRQQGQGQRGDRQQSQGQRGDRQQSQGQRGDRQQGQGQRGDRQQNQGQRGDRPQGQRTDRGDRPQGQRTDRGDRPQSQRNDRGERTDRGDRNQGRGDRRQDRSSDRPKMETKPGQKKQEKMAHHDHDKDHDKFAKLENGGKKNKAKIEERSLEKQARPKKHHVKAKGDIDEIDILEELPAGTVAITVPITVAGFCEQVGISSSQVIMSLMRLGIMANINQNLDEDTVTILADEMGLNVAVTDVEEEAEEEGLELFEDKEEDLKTRPPIITVMGHVDHGKTSLLDAIRKTNVTATESGGITQHIGASEVSVNGQKIVFLDTPGHEAFTAMRARGAQVTDIAVLVVAADDSVMPQTIESISHAKAAGVPIIVAINKIDKPGANPEKVKQDLTEHGVLVEDWGGDVIAVPVSAKTGEGIVNLLEMILLQAEVMELKANPNRLAMGSVIEARLDKARGPVATLLVTNGTLRTGMSIVAGTCSGKIRLMTNYKGEVIKKAGPATAVEVLGLTDVPEAGDEFNAVKEAATAREIAERRKIKMREEVLARNASTTLEQLFSQIQEGETKDLNLIIKGDVQGSVGAIVSSLEKLKNENVRVKIIHAGVGTITESDVMLAGTSGSIIIGFNVRPASAVQALAESENIQIRLYRVIYDIINDVEDAMKGMLDPEFREELLGKAEVRETFKVPGVGIVAGSYVLEGKVARNGEARLVRDGIVIHEGKIGSLRRFKDDAREVNQGYECGISLESYNDIKVGDVIECFQMVEIERT